MIACDPSDPDWSRFEYELRRIMRNQLWETRRLHGAATKRSIIIYQKQDDGLRDFGMDGRRW